MIRLHELRAVFAGRIRQIGDRRWLDTEVGGLRTFIICRDTRRGVAVDLAVFTPHTRELDPFLSLAGGQEWLLEERVLPCLETGFLFTGCRGGILFAINTAEPSLENIVGTLWELAAWAKKPWRPAELTKDATDGRRVRRERWTRVGLVLLVIAIVVWLRADAGLSLLALASSPAFDAAVA